MYMPYSFADGDDANLTITLNKTPSAIGDNIIKRLNKIINL